MSVTDDSIVERILVLARQHGEFVEAPPLESRLREDLGLDSLTLLSLLVDLENHFRIAFDEEEEKSLTTLAEVAQAVRTKLADLDAVAPP